MRNQWIIPCWALAVPSLESVYCLLHSCICSAAQEGCTEYRMFKGPLYVWYSKLLRSPPRCVQLVMQVFHQRTGPVLTFIAARKDGKRVLVSVCKWSNGGKWEWKWGTWAYVLRHILHSLLQFFPFTLFDLTALKNVVSPCSCGAVWISILFAPQTLFFSVVAEHLCPLFITLLSYW